MKLWKAIEKNNAELRGDLTDGEVLSGWALGIVSLGGVLVLLNAVFGH